MISRSDSEELFTLDTNYVPPDTMDFETQQVMARLAARSRSDSEEQFTLDTNYAPPDTTDFETQQVMKKTIPLKSVIRGGRRKPAPRSRKNKGPSTQSRKNKGPSTQSLKKKSKIQEEIPDFDDELVEDELDEDEAGLDDLENRQRSDVWKDFTVVEKPNGDLKALCNHCRNMYAWYSHSHGTSGLRRHRGRCKMYPSHTGRQQQLNTEGKVVSRKYGHTVFRQMVAKTIVQHDLPYAYVEYQKVRDTWAYLNADVQTTFVETQREARADVYRLYETHYIDRNRKLNNKILTFCALPPPHTGMNVAVQLLESLKEWEIEKKVFSITLDNATNGLKVIGDSLQKVRDSVKYVLGSETCEQLFHKCVDAAGVVEGGWLILDVPTRWNSTYYMLERAIKYRKAFVKLEVWLIHDWLRRNEESQDEIVRYMVPPMKEKFDKNWDEVSVVFAMAAVFDPQFKLYVVECCLGKLDMSIRDAKVKNLHDKLSILFETYDKKSKNNSPSTEPRETVSRADFFAFRQTSGIVSGKTPLEAYLEEPPLDFTNFQSLDILDWWKDNAHRYGDLAAMACDLLSIPITTVASESSFNIGLRVLNKYRSRLLPKNVQALICTRN
ncbi:PREDICTED: zinc finger BED domain-containing protein DAYSLEEPER-like [Brassica oleracea var. oleracea]|uniref:zinc finger BED domain-containing protein DAYSLEEPER-like n=1 Tax=Brassica oleracea var. oleracea TaxID=109376 RepID=UPI0006A6F1B5|nr:PREDICTED: zinc finger BED domain-containing protein DAYSLEEPER-like [Brassica oleracea var. oleracea]